MKHFYQRKRSSAVKGLVLVLVIGCLPANADDPSQEQSANDALQAWLATNADEPLIEPVHISRGMSPEMRGIVRQTNLLQGNSGLLGGIAGLLTGLVLWRAQLIGENAEQQTMWRNYEFLLALRQQLPAGSEGLDVVVLKDRKTGNAIVCFDKEYWDSHEEELVKRFPPETFGKMTSADGLNATRLMPIDDAPIRAREAFLRLAGPIIRSEADLTQHFQSYWAADPAHSPPPPPFDKTELGYTFEQMEKDLEFIRGFARAMLAYENKRRGRHRGRFGGVALGGGLKLPSGLSPTGLYLSGRKIFLRTGTEYLEIEGVDPEDFSVLLRSIALTGEPPVLSIGSEASDRAGYQRVSYFSGIRNSAVGAGMLKADLKLKGLLAGIGLGIGGSPSGPSHDFLKGFPQTDAARWVRLWLVSNEFSLEKRGKRLVLARRDISLNYEMILRDRLVNDAEVDRFIGEFNRRWPAFAAEIPEFGRLERLALASALAQWARNARVVIAPELWFIPFKYETTPEYVPALWTVNRAGLVSVSGGVHLLGDTQLAEPRLGLMLPFVLFGGFSGGEELNTRVGVVLLGLAVLLVVFLAWALSGFNRKLRWLSSRRITRAAALTIVFLLTVAGIQLVVAEIVNTNYLTSLDSEFLCLIIVMVVTPWLLKLFLRRSLDETQNRRATTLFILSLTATITLALLSSSLNILLVSANATSSTRVSVLNRIGAPMEIVGRPWASRGVESIGVRFIPESLVRATAKRFYLPSPENRTDVRPGFGNGSWGPETLDVPLLDDKSGPVGSVVEATKVSSEGFVSRQPAYNVEGKPPY